MTAPPPSQSFTGRARRRTTGRGVVVADRAARALISIGGIGTILAVLGVFVFLVWVVAPLFAPARIEAARTVPGAPGSELLHLGVDEYGVLAWTLARDGRLRVVRLDDGTVCHEAALFQPGDLASASVSTRGRLTAFGLSDGSVALAEIGFETERPSRDALPAEILAALAAAPERRVSYRDGLLQETGPDQLRFQHLVVEIGERRPVADGPVVRVRHVVRTTGPLVVALAEGAPRSDGAGEPAPAGSGALRLFAIPGVERSNFLTGQKTVSFDDPVELPFEPFGSGLPRFLVVSGSGSDVYLAWRDGALLRLSTGELDHAFVAETGFLTEPGVTLEAVATALGDNTLVWGDSSGRVRGGFPVRLADRGDVAPVEIRDAERRPGATTALLVTKELAGPGGAPATALAASARSRLLAAGFGDGGVRLFNVTSASELARAASPAEAAVDRLVIAPKEDLLVAAAGGRLYASGLDPRYPEATFAGFFRPVWYEGYPAPEHTWQSSSGTDDFEIKLGLVPLVFGTLKATVYSMLFGAPLALLAAIFTSEFLHHRAKAVIKPSIELMASLPSVVLGFLAALVFAPIIEAAVPATLASFVTLPAAFLAGACLWQLLPADLTLRWQSWRFLFVGLALPIGLAAAFALGPAAERWLFAGDIKAWLAWSPDDLGRDELATTIGGWMLVTLPPAALVVALANGRWATPWLRERGAQLDRRRLAALDAVKMLLVLASTVALAAAAAAFLDACGLDPRGGFVDTYVQRNALVVGFVMGFAIIPIIYTISEDALQAVPEHLRSASLGAGATPWQTAVRIIVPTAMSGLFSALMIGLGRAVGETMIVLMAAGNTPVLSWNLFEGFRTLSANIAVELPEAVKDSVHYRTLFLAALVLFAMTFVVNTVAEMVRQRFRRRAFQL